MINRIRDMWYRLLETRHQAWQDGYRQAESEWEEGYADKDVFIEEQADIIIALMDAIDRHALWAFFDPKIIEELRNYR